MTNAWIFIFVFFIGFLFCCVISQFNKTVALGDKINRLENILDEMNEDIKHVTYYLFSSYLNNLKKEDDVCDLDFLDRISKSERDKLAQLLNDSRYFYSAFSRSIKCEFELEFSSGIQIKRICKHSNEHSKQREEDDILASAIKEIGGINVEKIKADYGYTDKEIAEFPYGIATPKGLLPREAGKKLVKKGIILYEGEIENVIDYLWRSSKK